MAMPQTARRWTVEEVLALPDDVEPVALTPLGYPDKDRAATGRRPLDELVKHERW